MSLVLSVLSGTLRGRTFPVADGLTIGRQDADISLDDRRVSGLHAYVRGSDQGGWLLVDNGSKNGIRDAQGNRSEAISLKPEAQFQIGEVNFGVVLIEERQSAPTVAAPAGPVPADAAAPAPKRRSKTQRYWHEVLAEFLETNADKFKDRPRGLTPLEPALVLEFARGPQVNAKWILGYGPRRVGPAALDLPLWGENLPDVCFEIIPSPDGLIFKTAHAELVRLNGRAVDSDVLRMGDTIHIRDTLIEVDFLK